MAKRGGREKGKHLALDEMSSPQALSPFFEKKWGKMSVSQLALVAQNPCTRTFLRGKKPLSEKQIAANFRSLQRAGSSSIATLRQIVPPSPTSQARATSRLGFAFTVHYIYKEEKKEPKKDTKKVKRGRKRRESRAKRRAKSRITSRVWTLFRERKKNTLFRGASKKGWKVPDGEEGEKRCGAHGCLALFSFRE